MEQNEGFWQKNSQYIIPAAIIIVLAIVLFATQRGDNDRGGEQQNEQTNNQNTNPPSDNPSPTPAPTPSPTPTPNPSSSNSDGNVAATGTLRISDNLSRGNLMVDSKSGKIYIQTKRDFSSLVGKTVNLVASGSINSFTFIGFKESGVATKPSTTANLNISGKLQKSDNATKGNYVISSTSGKIYLKSARDYNAWVGSDVILTAVGNINSFTGATLTKK